MNKHPFLVLDFQSTVKLTRHNQTLLNKYLNLLSPVLERLIRKDLIIPCDESKELKKIRISLVICGDSRIKDMNRSYRQQDKVTDVISFPAYEDLRKSLKQALINDHELFLGDIVICHTQALRQAKQFKISYMDEFIHLFIHGFIHLLGYDHEISAKEEKLSQEWEDKALKLFSTKKKGSK